MSLTKILKRELEVVVNGQSVRFRVMKYFILSMILGAFYLWKGLAATGVLLLGLLIISLFIHFWFRAKTKGWTEPWGLYKPEPLSNKL